MLRQIASLASYWNEQKIFMKRLLLLAPLILFGLPGGVQANPSMSSVLNGSKWCTYNDDNAIASISYRGELKYIPHGGSCLSLVRIGQGPAWKVEFEWWKTDRGVRVKEYALATRVTPQLFNYMEAVSPEDRRAPYASTTPGTRGQGFITLTDNNKLKVSQLGRRPNGDTSIVVEYLSRVEKFPDIEIPLTFPTE